MRYKNDTFGARYCTMAAAEIAAPSQVATARPPTT
jgi:hypothetical protein